MRVTIALAALAVSAAASRASVLAADEYNAVPGRTAASGPLGLHGVNTGEAFDAQTIGGLLAPGRTASIRVRSKGRSIG